MVDLSIGRNKKNKKTPKQITTNKYVPKRERK